MGSNILVFLFSIPEFDHYKAQIIQGIIGFPQAYYLELTFTILKWLYIYVLKKDTCVYSCLRTK